MTEFNEVDKARSTPQVRSLLSVARSLQFKDDIQHWTELLKSRGIDA